MTISIILSLLVNFFVPPAHDVPLSITTLQMEQQEMSVELKFDKEDLAEALKIEIDKNHSEQIKKYILRHTQFHVNEKQLELSIISIENDDEHFNVKALLSDFPANAKNMTIHNTCLVKEIDNHSNIIYLNYADQRRGFRLHKGRPSTSFEL